MAVKQKKAVSRKTTRRKPTLGSVIIDAIQDKKGQKIVSLKLDHISDAVAKEFIICEAESTTQVRAIGEYIKRQTIDILGEKVWHSEGVSSSDWIILDYVNIVVHIFLPHVRAFYQLEELWHDAKIEEH